MAWQTLPEGENSSMPRLTTEWVESQLLPILRESSRRGVIVTYDSGIEPRSKSKEIEQPPQIFSDKNRAKILTDALTPLFSIIVNSSVMVSGKITYAIRASDGIDHQSLIGELLFAIVNKAGTFTTSPSSTATMPDLEEYVSSSAATLSTLWSITTSGSVATVNVTPSGSLTETGYGIEYNVEIFPKILISEV